MPPHAAAGSAAKAAAVCFKKSLRLRMALLIYRVKGVSHVSPRTIVAALETFHGILKWCSAVLFSRTAALPRWDRERSGRTEQVRVRKLAGESISLNCEQFVTSLQNFVNFLYNL